MDLGGAAGKLKGILSKDIAVKVIVAVGVLGMVLILVAQLTDSGAINSSQPSPQTALAEPYTTDEYAAMLEQKLEALVVNIDGVGRAQVMVTLEHGVEYIYAQEEKSSLDQTTQPSGDTTGKTSLRQDTQYSYVLVDTEYGKKQALIRTQLQPKVQGVVIVCDGADNIRVQEKLINVVTTALNIPTTRVCVVKIDQ